MRISKKSRLAAVLGATVMAVGLAAAPASARHANQSGGAAGVIAAVVQVDRTLNDLVDLNIEDSNIEIVTVKDSLNNVLNNNRVEVLSRNQTTIQNFLNNCTIASCFEISNFLNNNDVAISDVVAVEVLSGGDITVFVQQ